MLGSPPQDTRDLLGKGGYEYERSRKRAWSANEGLITKKQANEIHAGR